MCKNLDQKEVCDVYTNQQISCNKPTPPGNLRADPNPALGESIMFNITVYPSLLVWHVIENDCTITVNELA
jgi:hypothetical protein